MTSWDIARQMEQAVEVLDVLTSFDETRPRVSSTTSSPAESDTSVAATVEKVEGDSSGNGAAQFWKPVDSAVDRVARALTFAS